MSCPDYFLFSDAEWHALPDIYAEPIIKWYSPDLAGNTYEDVPLLLDVKGRLIDAPTSWLTELRVNGAKRRTVKQYTYAVRLYWNFLGRRAWTAPDDALLREWRDQMLARGISGKRINLCIDAVVAFFLWAQREGIVSRRVGATPDGGMPFPVRLVPRRGRRRSLVSVVRADTKRVPRLPIPDVTDMDRLYERLTGPDEALSERNCLMADLAVQCGLRREEFTALNKDDIPTRTAIAIAKTKSRPCFLTVIGKGEKERTVPILPELAEKLRDHIDGNRQELLGPTTRDSGALFLSRKSGDRLSEFWVSRLFSNAFGRTARVKLTLHRLRARFASLLVLTLARRDVNESGLTGIREDFILMAAAEILGHNDIATLQRYVDLAIRTLQAEAAGKAVPNFTLGVDVEALEEVTRQSPAVRFSNEKRVDGPASKRNASGRKRK